MRLFGPGTEAEARSQRKPAERGCGTKETVRARGAAEGTVPRKPREEMTLVKKDASPKGPEIVPYVMGLVLLLFLNPLDFGFCVLAGMKISSLRKDS